MSVFVTHDYEPAEPGVGIRDDEHTLHIMIRARTGDTTASIDDAIEILECWRDKLDGADA